MPLFSLLLTSFMLVIVEGGKGGVKKGGEGKGGEGRKDKGREEREDGTNSKHFPI